jgi:hypothetical protein
VEIGEDPEVHVCTPNRFSAFLPLPLSSNYLSFLW